MLLFGSYSFGQISINHFPIKILIEESNKLFIDHVGKNNFMINYNQSFYFNTNLPNFENKNGYYFPKGFGSISGFLINYNTNHLQLTVEPTIFNINEYKIIIPDKKKTFSVLNDVPYKENQQFNSIKNFGIKLKSKYFSIGYGNWNMWWGPGIHNSLVLSNNAEGFYHYFIKTNQNIRLLNNTFFQSSLILSEKMVNNDGQSYYLSAWFMKVKNKLVELGISSSILSGGNPDIYWTKQDALSVIFNKNKIKYWDYINAYYLVLNFEKSRLKIFYEFGYPNRSFLNKNSKIYFDNAQGSNLGMRKYGLGGYEKLVLGFEYARLVQGIYYNILPTPNWYDNINFNYSSYNNRRWAAHSGSDSDDFLIFMGHVSDRKGLIFGINYERHGITYNFPPEVKIEYRVSINYKIKDMFLYINYENEYFRHYGFVDKNNNVWDEKFEEGSVQRTNSLIFSLERQLKL